MNGQDNIRAPAGGVLQPPTRAYNMERIRTESHSFSGLLWFYQVVIYHRIRAVGFLKGVLALLIWPYYLGSSVKVMIHESLV